MLRMLIQAYPSRNRHSSPHSAEIFGRFFVSVCEISFLLITGQNIQNIPSYRGNINDSPKRLRDGWLKNLRFQLLQVSVQPQVRMFRLQERWPCENLKHSFERAGIFKISTYLALNRVSINLIQNSETFRHSAKISTVGTSISDDGRC
jgi:hypothetical protein